MLNIETPEDFLFEDETEMERYLRSILSIDLEQFLSLWNDGYMEEFVKEMYDKMEHLQSEDEKLIQEKVKVELEATLLDQQSI
tara:strand:- start:466 stop:714 length:249 start_codon:yes stop_codon:yes gene_type:complete